MILKIQSVITQCREFTAEVQARVDAAYSGLVSWHNTHEA